jgi:hypothetical protein
MITPGEPSEHDADEQADECAAPQSSISRRTWSAPEEVVAQMRHAPFQPALEAIAHTLVYEATIVGDRTLPTELAGGLTIPTLVIAGGARQPTGPRYGLGLCRGHPALALFA